MEVVTSKEVQMNFTCFYKTC